MKSNLSLPYVQSSEYKYKKELFLLNAREWTEKYASQQKRVRNTLRVLS